jgi:glycosyltransferase involved in cell wall biosynthesis
MINAYFFLFYVYLPSLKTYRIAYLTETSPDDKHAWSGTVHYIYEALKNEGHFVIPLGPKQPKFIGFICKVINQLSLKILNKRFDYRHSKIYSKEFGRLFANELKNINYDIVVACGGTEYVAYLKSTKPIFIIVDRTIEGALGYHSILSNLLKFSKNQSIDTDKKAMLESSKVFFSSDWAADHAKKYYNLPNSKTCVLPFGANLDSIPDKEIALVDRDLTTVKMLLIGTYWFNKGADIALNALNHLIKNNINATLTIVGCLPPNQSNQKGLTIIPFVDKNSKEGIKQLWELYLSHHFFILPTRFDCTPIVFCEASAFGLPILAANTGGVAGHIFEAKNGYLINYEDMGMAYAEKIMSIIKSPNEYKKLRISTRRCYDDQLNWTIWANKITEEISNSIF